MNIVRWGILGYARIAEMSTIPAILEAENAVFYAMASRDQAKREACVEKFHCEKTFETYDELLDDPKVDAVYVPLPNSLHKEWAIKAMEKGKHVLCEKPMTLNEKDAIEMVESSKKNGVILMEAFMYRYTHRTRKVQEILESGVIGEVKHVTSSFRFFLNRANTIKMNSALGGGSLYDVGCYPLNFVQMVVGEEPSEVHVTAEMESGVDVSASVLLKYESGKIATIHSGFNAFGRNYSEITGTKGRLEIPDTFLDNEGSISLVTDSGVEEISIPGCHRYTLEIEDFSRAVLLGEKPLFSLEETLRNSRIMDKVLEQLK
ncbi:MAG: Gfo/Idh/MocA family oxidoreductase [Clostridiaceae bacterium]